MGACDKNQIKGVAFTDRAKIRIQISQGINKQTVGQTLYNHICTDCSGLVGKKINPPPPVAAPVNRAVRRDYIQC